jgi:hypothetical protein
LFYIHFMMKKITFVAALACMQLVANAQTIPVLTPDVAVKLSKYPLGCIIRPFPNKSSHTANSAIDARLLPVQLHPVFYGCFDWHSSVHGHWMLVRLLKTVPGLSNKAEIISQLNRSFNPQKMRAEAKYFTKYKVADSYERTYGWAWLLKLDQELYTWDNPKAKKWHAALQPLTQQILKLWKAYLPKETYPTRSGLHPNTAFGLAFALDWARTVKDTSFETQLDKKARLFYLKDVAIPGYLEPDGTDFFSPSLEVADLMRRVLPNKEFVNWLDKFYEERSIKRISETPVISDINDYYQSHLIGLSFTRAWCMKRIAKELPEGHKWKNRFEKTANELLSNALPLVFKGNYGGDHWLATFAVYSLEK